MARSQAIRAFILVLFLALPMAAQGITDVFVHDGNGRHRPHRTPGWRSGVAVESHLVETTIEGRLATTTVNQVFRNRHRRTVEGTYLFPIPQGASLTKFAMEMNGKMVTGEVVERDRARQIYEGIVRQSLDPGLLEYAGSKLFRARVFPIHGQGTVAVKLSYVQTLDRDGGVIEYRYPLKTQAFSSAPVKTLGISVRILTESGLKTVFSSSHAIDKAQKGDRETIVSFEGKSQAASKDFQLYFRPSADDVGFALLSDKKAGQDGFFMINLAPKTKFTDSEILPRDVVFVMDTSGSMREDEKIAQAKKALLYGLKGMRAGDRFEVIAFSTEARPFRSKLVAATPENIAAAAAWIKTLEATGGTNIMGALEAALARMEKSDRVQSVVFLTDGLPTVEERDPRKILAVAKQSNGAQARIFSWGVGYDVNTTFLDLLGEQNGGVSDYVTPSQNIEIVLSSFFDKIAYPVLSDLKLVVDGVEIHDVFPPRLPDLFKGGEVTVFGRYKGAGNHAVRLKGKVGQGEKEFIFEGKFADAPKQRDFVSVLWARRKVGYLWEEIQQRGFQQELRDEIVSLGKTYAIATPYTSFLVVEDQQTQRDHAELQREGRRLRRYRSSFGVLPGRGKTVTGGGGGGSGGFAPGGGGTPGAGSGPVTKAGPPTGGVGGNQGGRSAPVPSEAAKPGTKPTGNPANLGSPRQEVGKIAVDSALRKKSLKEAKIGDALIDEVDAEEVLTIDRNLGGKKSPPRLIRRRFEGRTFVREGDVWVEDKVASIEEAKRAKSRVAVKAFSKLYFELLAKETSLGKLLAEFQSVEVRIDGVVYRFLAVAKKTPVKKTEVKPEAPVGGN